MKVFLKTKNIKLRLIRKNRSQNWLADQLKVSCGYLSQLMDGGRNPSPKVRRRLMDAFPECDFDYLFMISDKDKD